MYAYEEISDLQEEEVAIIEEIAEELEGRQKDKLSAVKDIPRKKLFKETKVDKVLSEFNTQHYKDELIILCRSCCCYKLFESKY